jgi:regulator of nucleoside diphosphate kinase
MIDVESDELSNLALGVEKRLPELAGMLLAEIERAELHSAADMPAGVVTMQSSVEFVDEGNGSRRTVQLVYPVDADISAGRISILTPVGAGLIGLGEGQSIVWPDRDGRERRLRIVKVTRPTARLEP